MWKLKLWKFTRNFLVFSLSCCQMHRPGRSLWLAMKSKTKSLRSFSDTSIWISTQDQISLITLQLLLFSKEQKSGTKSSWQRLLWSPILIQLRVGSRRCFSIVRLSLSSMNLGTSCTTYALKPTFLDFQVPQSNEILSKCQVKCLRTGYGTKKFSKGFQNTMKLVSHYLIRWSTRKLKVS